MNLELTRDADFMLCALYSGYQSKRKSGIDKSNAKYMGDSENIRESFMPEWMFEDVDETCRELHRADFVDCRYYDDTANEITLTDKAIIYMENRFSRGASEILDYMVKIKNLIFP